MTLRGQAVCQDARVSSFPNYSGFTMGLLVGFFLLVGFIRGAASELVRLPVLVYHQIESPVRSDVSCTPEQFSAQMLALINEGFTPISLADIRLFLVGGLRQVARPVAITFDDGYESNFLHALPVARRLHVPMTVFVVTSRIGRQPQFTRYLSGRQIREMADSGWFDFGSHTDDLHTDLMRIWNAFHGSPNPMAAVVESDLRASQKRFREIIGHPVIALAWPYGKFNAETRNSARRAGFVLHFTSRSGYNEPNSDPFGIKRIPVTSRDNPDSVLRKVRSYFSW